MRVFVFAGRTAALPDLLRGLLRQFQQRVIAAIDVVEALGKRSEALLVVEDAAGVDIGAVPARLDVLQQLRRPAVRGWLDTHTLDRAAAAQRFEIALETIAAVLD